METLGVSVIGGNNTTCVVKTVCPSIDELEKEENGKCICTLCEKVISNSSALELHLVKAHRKGNIQRYEKGINSTKYKTVYCCPVQGCPRGSKNKDRHFSNIWHVRQHYLNCHAERKQECMQCNAKFGSLNRLKQHEKNCGKIFKCSCGCPFTSKEALMTHGRLKRHTYNLDVKEIGSNDQPKRRKKATQSLAEEGPNKEHSPQLIAVPMLLLVRANGNTSSGHSRRILPTTCIQNSATTHSHQVQPINILERGKTEKHDSHKSPKSQLTLQPSLQKDGSTSVDGRFDEINLTNILGSKKVEHYSVGSVISDGSFNVSHACTQTKEQTYGNQFSQTASASSELAENQTQTLSLVDFLEYHQLSDAFTQTSKVDSLTRQSSLTEIETQTSEIINMLEDNVTDAFTQTFQSGNTDQYSQTTSSLFNMITGTTQTGKFVPFQEVTSPIPQSTNDLDIFKTTNSSSFVSTDNIESFSSNSGIPSVVSAFSQTFAPDEEYAAEDFLNDAFTQTWSQCSNDQFSQTNWSNYIEDTFLDETDVTFSPIRSCETPKNADSFAGKKPASSPTIPSGNSCIDPVDNKLVHGSLSSYTQTTVSFNTMIDLAYEEDSRDILTPSLYLADAGTQTA